MPGTGATLFLPFVTPLEKAVWACTSLEIFWSFVESEHSLAAGFIRFHTEAVYALRPWISRRSTIDAFRVNSRAELEFGQAALEPPEGFDFNCECQIFSTCGVT